MVFIKKQFKVMAGEILRPYAINTGSTISGTTQVGDIAIGENDTYDYSTRPGGVTWYMGPDENLGYLIVHPDYENNRPRFKRTSGFNDDLFLIKANEVASIMGHESFTDVTDAVNWMNLSGVSTTYETDWVNYWTKLNDVLFFGLYSEIVDGMMPNKKVGASDYLTVVGSEGNETYQCPNTIDYIAADTDYIWFKPDGTIRTPTTSDLISYDFQRTPIYYLDNSPNSIVAIMILKSGTNITGITRNKLFHDFHLPIMWDNSLNEYGRVKSNRGATQVLWTPEYITPSSLILSGMSGGVKIDWIDNSLGEAETEIWVRSNNEESVLLTTINTGTTTYNDIFDPVDMRYYKLRAKKGTYYSPFTEEESIALLGDELWSCSSNDATWSILSSNSAYYSASVAGSVYSLMTITAGNKYRLAFTIDATRSKCTYFYGRSGVVFPAPFNGTYRTFSAGTIVNNLVASSSTDRLQMVNEPSGGGTLTLTNISVKQILYT